MRKACLLLFLLLGILNLPALEIWDEKQLLQLLSTQELQSISLQEGDHRVLPLKDLLPLYQNILQVEIQSSEGTLILKDPALIESSNLFIRDEGLFFISGPHIFSSPERIQVYGQVLEPDRWILWLDNTEAFLEEEMRLFSKLHNLEMEVRRVEDIPASLADSWYSGKEIPDLIVYNHRDVYLLRPYLRDLTAEETGLNVSSRFPFGFPLYIRKEPIHWDGSDAVSLTESFLAYQLTGDSPLQLLERLSRDQRFPPIPYERQYLTLLGFPKGENLIDPVSLAFAAYFERRSRLLLLEEMDKNITASALDPNSMEEGLLFPPQGEYDAYRKELLRTLPLVRSRILSPEDAYQYLKGMNHEF